MKIIPLKDKRPPEYEWFTAIDIETGETFDNYLIFSNCNKFYIAGRKFTHWMKCDKSRSIDIDSMRIKCK